MVTPISDNFPSLSSNQFSNILRCQTSNVVSAYLCNEDHRVFDNDFFGIHQREAESMDPQQKMLLEAVYEAIEAAGYSYYGLRGSETAVFLGQMTDDYRDILYHDMDNVSQYAATGASRAITANRISYFFDWRGPSANIDTACSSSLVALHQAVQTLRSGESSLAVVAGVNLILGPETFIVESKLHMLSPTGRCRMWDARADGYARGEGLAVVVLKPLSRAVADNDHIECIIRESGTNQDGRTVGLTVPSAAAQAALISSTYARCGLNPTQPNDRCQYFEAHGTGTAGGDPKEAQAIRDVFFPPKIDDKSNEINSNSTVIGDEDDRNQHKLYVGSVKTVIGHTEGAAGLVGVLKASLALQNAQIPPNMHFEELSPSVEPYYNPHLQIPTNLLPWPASTPGVPRRASINSFGFGGTNAHVIIESWDGGASAYDGHDGIDNTVKPSQDHGLKSCGPFILSASSQNALAKGVSALSRTLKDAADKIDMKDLAWTLQSRRTEFPVRAAFSAVSRAELVDKLDAYIAETGHASEKISVSPKFPLRVLGIFTGQGAQWHRMGVGLFEQSLLFRSTIEQLDDSLAKLRDPPSWSLVDVMATPGDESRVHEAEFAQPLTTALQIALVDLLRSIGVALDAVVGHSSGEIAAAYASGYLSSSDAIRVAYYRGLHSSPARSPVNGQSGSMLAVGTTLNDATSICQRGDFLGRIMVAAHNSPSNVTLSGDSDAILEVKALFDHQGTFTRVLKINKAYHSHHMQPCAEGYLESLRQCTIKPQRTSLQHECSWYSSVYGPDGRSIHDPDALSDRYWIENLINPVLLHHAIERAVREEAHCFDLAIEIGLHPTLQRPVTDTLRAVTGVNIPYVGVLSRWKIDTIAISDALGFIWTRTWDPIASSSIISWHALQKAFSVDDESRQPRLLKTLPSYSWDHENPLFFESSTSNSWRVGHSKIHPTLGRATQHGGRNKMTMVWRNILKLTELKWLRGHRFQNQVVFPAAGYVSMAVDAANALAETVDPYLKQPAAHILELEELRFHNAITFDEYSSSGVEVTLIIFVQHRDIGRHVLTAEYTCYSGDASTRPDEIDKQHKRTTTLNFSGKATITLRPSHKDQAGASPFPARIAPNFPLSDVDIGRFYSWASSIGLQYSGDFLLESIKRRRNMATVTVKQNVDSNGMLMHVHPAMLDAAFQGIFAAHSFPGDGGIRASYLPSSVDRIRVDMAASLPCLCEQSRPHSNSKTLLVDCYVRHDSTAVISGDIDLFCAGCERPSIQVEGLSVSRLGKPTSQDDRTLFSRIVWGRDLQSAGFEVKQDKVGFQVERMKLNETCDRMAYFYIRQLCSQIHEEEISSMEWHFQSLMDWALHHIVPTVQSGHHTRVRAEWIFDTHRTIDALSDEYAAYVEARLVRAVGQRLPSIVKTSVCTSITSQASILDTLMEDNMLHLLYHHAEGFRQANELVGIAAGQLAHRYPRMRILEVGGGTGAATLPVLSHLSSHFASYTFTDISPGFFRDAQSKFASSPGADRLNYAVLDIEQDLQSSEFEENSFDLIIASNVLHATRFLARTVANCRRLLKPGGFLILDEVTSDTLYGPFIVSGLSGWWLGREDDGRLHGPIVSEDRWDCVLKTNGFSGIDHLVRDSQDSSTYLFSVIISQATDARVHSLRSPLHASSSKKPVVDSVSRPDPVNNLVIVGAKTGYVADTALQMSILLQPFARELIILDGWEALEAEAATNGANLISIIKPGSDVICLSELQDDTSTELSTISHERLHALQSIFQDTSHVFLLTSGCHAKNPQANMMVGLCRTIMCETPHLRILHVDLDDASARCLPEPADLSEMFLRMVWLDRPDYNEILWSNETELAVREKLLYIPRIKPDDILNRRLASETRTIEKKISLKSVHSSSINITVDETGNISLLEAAAPAPAITTKRAGSEHTIHFISCYSTLFSFSNLDGAAPIYIGVESTTDQAGHFSFAEMPTNASSLDVPQNQIIACNTSEIRPAHMLSRIATTLVCESLVADLSGTLWLHEGPTEVIEMVAQIAKSRGINVFFSTSNVFKDASYERATFIHLRSTQRVLEAVVPSNVQRLVLGMANDSEEVRSFQKAVLRSRLVMETEFRCLRQDIGQLKTVPLGISKTRMRNIIMRESSLFSSDCGHLETSRDISTVDVATISAIRGNRKVTSIVDWSPAHQITSYDERLVSIPIRPLVSNGRHLFSFDKTYLLAGLAGEVGMSLVEWMAGAGARYFAIVSRNPQIDAEVLQYLKRLGIILKIWAVDITDKQALSQAHSEMATVMPPIAGVANGAMVLRDRPFGHMTPEDFKAVLGPKVQGSNNLDDIFHADPSLEFFVLFASGTSIVGNAGQSNYSAANMFMAALAEQRRRRGMAASVIYLGTLLGIGHVARLILERTTGGKRTVESQLQRFSSLPLSEANLHTAFAEAVDSGRPESDKDPAIIVGLGDGKDAPWRSTARFSYWLSHLSGLQRAGNGSNGDESMKYFQRETLVSIQERVGVALDISQEEGLLLLEENFLQQLGAILQTPIAKIDKDASLVALGIDSLVATELRSWFLKQLGVDVSILQILGGASLTDICRLAITRVRESKSVGKSLDLKGNDKSSSVSMAQHNSTEPRSEYIISGSLSASDGTPPSPSQLELLESHPISSTSSPPLRVLSPGVSAGDYCVKLGEMSMAQARLYFLHQYIEEKSAYNVGYVGKYQGSLDVKRLKKAVWDVCVTHESLRSCYFVDKASQKAVQAVLPTPRPEWKHVEIQEASEVREEVEWQRNFLFDIEHGHVFKVTVMSLSPVLHHIIFLHHHIALDGVGWFLFMTHLNDAYSGQQISPPVQQCIEMSAKERAQRGSATDMHQELAFWGKMHRDPHEPLPLFTFAKIRNRQMLNKYETQTLDIELTPDLAKRVEQTAASLGVTAFHFYLSALAVFLKRCLNVDDFSIGILDANRPDPEDASTMGYFLNLLPLRYRISSENDKTDVRTRFSYLVKESRNKVLAALSNSRAPFDAILDHLHVSRAGSHHPLFQVALDYREGYSAEDKFGDGTIQWDHKQSITVRNPHDIFVNVTPATGSRTFVHWTTQKYMYSASDSRLMITWYTRILDALARDPSISIARCPTATEKDLRQAIALGTGKPVHESPRWGQGTLIHQVERMACQYPASIAIIDGSGVKLTYSQMIKRTEYISRHLKRAMVDNAVDLDKSSIAPVVGTIFDPMSDHVCSLLAILKLGLTCVGLDLRNPEDRLSVMLLDCRPQVLICNSSTKDQACRLAVPVGAVVLDIDEIIDIETELDLWISEGIKNRSSLDQRAVILYTSGSTGTPKGVLLSHMNLHSHIKANTELFGIRNDEVILHQTSPGFDFSLDQIFHALGNGGTLVIVGKEGRGDPTHIARLMLNHDVTFTVGCPSEYLGLLNYGFATLRRCKRWRLAFSGGEKLTFQLRKGFQKLQLDGLQLMNVYGPTEVTIACARGIVPYRTDEDLEAQGDYLHPMPKYSILVVDPEMNLLPVGIPGEVLIAGEGVALGYLNRPTETEHRFIEIEDPGASFSLGNIKRAHNVRTPTIRVYRSGDHGRLLEDGSINLLGRMEGSGQVKIRGMRVELDEVANAMIRESAGALTAAAVSLRRWTADVLVAFVVFDVEFPRKDQADLAQRLRTSLPLPSHMCPSITVSVDELPTNVNGKLDRVALDSLPIPTENWAGHNNQKVKALTTLELDMKNVWREVLHCGQFEGDHPILISEAKFDADTDFFLIGGNSILAIKLRAIIQTNFGVLISLPELFRMRTLSNMSAVVDGLLNPKGTKVEAKSLKTDWAGEVAALFDGLPPLASHSVTSAKSPNPKSGTANVLLTGATGFLGTHLLGRLVSDIRVGEIHCVAVRPGRHVSVVSHKIIEHAGDLADPLLGLSQEAFSEVASRVDLVIHNGAQVSFLQPYHAGLRGPNVVATRTLCTLALIRGVPFHYVSSAAVAGVLSGSKTGKVPPTLGPVSVANSLPDQQQEFELDGYALSKWASEALLQKVSTEYGLPVIVHRAASLVGEGAPKLDVVAALIGFSRILGAVPALQQGLKSESIANTGEIGVLGAFDFVPVEHMAKQLVNAALESLFIPTTPPTAIRFIHYSNDDKVQPQELQAYMQKTDKRPYSKMAVGDWLDAAREAGLDSVTYEYLRGILREGKELFMPVLKR